ncbi:hypothetical protein QJS83_13935 [Bdellovibrio sp. 22V]|uniref:hypothetical protein n=1 Tax=Bdellovibrio TaxID=958 RepID=UPI0025427DDC|nr:hypothetical protein [Bdellovibrio sp. 22V]WII71565.1 hypothetical protein QJS83_13935 [Bdellovibrio sp. 22V]
MKTILSFFATILFAANAFTQTSAELTCRAQAKEIALQTYSSCVTEARNNQVEEIRKNYQKELSDLKAKYDKELKKMGGGGAKKAVKNGAPTVREVQAPKAVKGIAKQLPGRGSVNTEAAPIQVVSEGTKVVAVGTEDVAEGLEKEAAEADQVEIIEMPVE